MYINAILPGPDINDMLAVAIRVLLISLALWLVAINAVTFLVFGLDKWLAKRKENRPETRRIPETVLFLLATLGGSIGALLGMRVWRHKTLHKSFRYGIPLILAGQLILAGWLVGFFVG